MTDDDTPTVDELMHLITHPGLDTKMVSEVAAEKVLRSIDDPEYLRAIKDILLSLQGDSLYSARSALASSISKGQRQSIMTLIAHREWHLDHRSDTGYFLILAHSLFEGGVAIMTSDGRIENLEKLLEAATGFVFTDLRSLARSEYVQMAYRHVDHLPELMQYRTEHGLDTVDADRSKPFVPLDDDHFKEYLSHGVLRDGCI